MIRIAKSASLTLLALLLSILLSACGLGSAQPGRKPSPDWSRGISLSSDVGGTVGMVVAGKSDEVHFAWPTAVDDQAHIHYLHMDEDAEITVEKDLDLPEGRVRSPRLLLAGDDKVHLVWARRVSGSRNWELWHSLLDRSGELIDRATQFSPPDMRVSAFTVAQDAEGTGYVVWEDDSSNALFGARLTAESVEEPVRLVESGTMPGIAVDGDGNLHIAWFEPLGIRYAAIPGGELGLTDGTRVADLEEQTVNTIDGPALGVAEGQVYVAWSTFANVGLESGSGWTEFVSFPSNAPALTAATRVWLLHDEEQPYYQYSGNFPLTVLADPVTSPLLTTSIILEPNAGGSKGNEVAMVVSALQGLRLDEYVQMVLLLFEDGQFKGYQLAGKTESLSREGSLLADVTGDLHLTWREGTGTKLYYATTSPETRSQLDRLGGDDLASALLGGSLDAVTGALFFPLSLIWFVPGFLVLGIWKLRRDDETMSDRGSQILVVLAIISYQFMKVLFMPSIVSYIPFSAWFDVSETAGRYLQIIVPAMILAVGIVAAEVVRRRRPTTSALVYFLIACGIDAILTLGVYGVGYLGYI